MNCCWNDCGKGPVVLVGGAFREVARVAPATSVVSLPG